MNDHLGCDLSGSNYELYIYITTNILNNHEHLVITTTVTRCHQRWLANPGKT